MIPKAANTARAGTPSVSPKDKDSAKQCLILADKFLKESDFERARTEVGKAQKFDPTNAYSYAFLDRIAYFEEEQKKKEAPKKAEEEAKKKAAEEAKAKAAEEAKKKAEEEARKKAEEETKAQQEEDRRKAEEAARAKEEEKKKKMKELQLAEQKRVAEEEKRKEESKRKIEEARRKLDEQRKQAEGRKTQEEEEEKRRVEEEAKKKAEEDARAKIEAEAIRKATQKISAPPKEKELVDKTRLVIADVLASRSTETQKSVPQETLAIGKVLEELSQASHHTPNSTTPDLDTKLDEMRRQIEMLTKSLDQERKVREEMNQQQLKGAIKQLRSAMEKAWVNGVPKDPQLRELHDLAVALGVPEDVEQTLNRETKLDMYSRAVKEVVAKQKLLRNSSRTLEWLRKVYQVTLDEYLEYESKFLMDLVADQYKGTVLLVSADPNSKELGTRLKSTGYAVVNATSPENALEKIEKINPHYILCDMEFSAGSLSGTKFLHVLRANTKFNYIPFILMCEKSETTQLKSSELRSTEGFIEKPVDFDTLGSVMDEKLMAFRQYLSSL